MTPVLERCDRDGTPAYLEATNDRNRALSEGHGFRATGAIPVPGGPRPLGDAARSARIADRPMLRMHRPAPTWAGAFSSPPIRRRGSARRPAR
jgi:hypothetical protein